MWIGKLKHSKENIKWTNKPIKTLGIYYGHDYIECEKLNCEKKLKKLIAYFCHGQSEISQYWVKY